MEEGGEGPGTAPRLAPWAKVCRPWRGWETPLPKSVGYSAFREKGERGAAALELPSGQEPDRRPRDGGPVPGVWYIDVNRGAVPHRLAHPGT
jgi:hypothetical protein